MATARQSAEALTVRGAASNRLRRDGLLCALLSAAALRIDRGAAWIPVCLRWFAGHR